MNISELKSLASKASAAAKDRAALVAEVEAKIAAATAKRREAEAEIILARVPLFAAQAAEKGESNTQIFQWSSASDEKALIADIVEARLKADGFVVHRGAWYEGGGLDGGPTLEIHW
jgi:hypothetical protein